MAMMLEVYQTDAEAFEAAAALAAERLGGAGPRATVALAGGRTGRGVMVALAARGDLPWERVEWFWSDERCVPADDARSNVRLARDSLLVPRGLAAARIHPPPVELGAPADVAVAYAATLARELGPGSSFDLVLLGLGRRAGGAALVPGAAALGAATAVAAIAADEVAEEPRLARITLTPPTLAAARPTIVGAVGDEKAGAVAAALADGADPTTVPAALVRPSERVTWILDRAAAAVLLRDARPAEGDPPGHGQ
jgi:6-phosphogluconolactonase